VFISYEWDSQEEVIKIKENLEKAGFKIFIDVGQIGGGHLLYDRIDQAIRNSKVVIAFITPKFVVSHFCNREMALADLLRKPIVPIMLKLTPWPPPGGMSLILSQLVYIDYFGVGGHGGSGYNADRDQRNNEIVAMVARHVDPSSYFLMNIDRITDNNQENNNNNKNNRKSKKNILFNPSQFIRDSSQYYHNSNNNNPNTNTSTNNFFINDLNSARGVNQRFAMSQNSTHRLNNGNNNNNPFYLNHNNQNNTADTTDVNRCILCNII
jgi:hypothetical protein